MNEDQGTTLDLTEKPQPTSEFNGLSAEAMEAFERVKALEDRRVAASERAREITEMLGQTDYSSEIANATEALKRARSQDALYPSEDTKASLEAAKARLQHGEEMKRSHEETAAALADEVDQVAAEAAEARSAAHAIVQAEFDEACRPIAEEFAECARKLESMLTRYSPTGHVLNLSRLDRDRFSMFLGLGGGRVQNVDDVPPELAPLRSIAAYLTPNTTGVSAQLISDDDLRERFNERIREESRRENERARNQHEEFQRRWVR